MSEDVENADETVRVAAASVQEEGTGSSGEEEEEEARPEKEFSHLKYLERFFTPSDADERNIVRMIRLHSSRAFFRLRLCLPREAVAEMNQAVVLCEVLGTELRGLSYIEFGRLMLRADQDLPKDERGATLREALNLVEDGKFLLLKSTSEASIEDYAPAPAIRRHTMRPRLMSFIHERKEHLEQDGDGDDAPERALTNEWSTRHEKSLAEVKRKWGPRRDSGEGDKADKAEAGGAKLGILSKAIGIFKSKKKEEEEKYVQETPPRNEKQTFLVDELCSCLELLADTYWLEMRKQLLGSALRKHYMRHAQRCQEMLLEEMAKHHGDSHPKLARIWKNFGDFHAELFNIEEAEEAYRQAAKVEQGDLPRGVSILWKDRIKTAEGVRKEHLAATKLQAAWRSYQDRRLVKMLKEDDLDLTENPLAVRRILPFCRSCGVSQGGRYCAGCGDKLVLR